MSMLHAFGTTSCTRFWANPLRITLPARGVRPIFKGLGGRLKTGN
jgi:hypothetical protein